MAEPLKYLYNQLFFNKLTAAFEHSDPGFDSKFFLSLIHSEQWHAMELKQRIRHITVSLSEVLPASYGEAVSILKETAVQLQGYGLECLFFPDYVEIYGLEDWETSLSALALFTQYSSAEFAVRAFIIRDPERMMDQMLKWAQQDNPHLRRLASEGCRPRLPWACALPDFKKDPSPILPILALLKEDASEYVRKSVANNLNDISKDHPTLVLDLAQSWFGRHPHTDWVLKHGCRTLLKSGNARALSIFGFIHGKGAIVNDLVLSESTIAIGDCLAFSFTLTVDAVNQEAPVKLRIEYGIYYMKANGAVSRKIFKITEKYYAQDKPLSFTKKHSFQDLSTRKHYTGNHHITIIINGKEMAQGSFNVVSQPVQ